MGSRTGTPGRTIAAAVVACGIVPTLAMPFLVLAAGGIGRSNGEACSAPADDGEAPTILGTSELDADALGAWWTDQGRGQPAGLDVTVAQLSTLYIQEGRAEGVRGDLAFAQAVHETGYFTSTDTALNNFAGIAHPDNARTGQAFASAETGVRAHIQLLKKYAAGNDAPLASPHVAPRAAARAVTWPDLARTWASDPDYWTKLSSLYQQILANSGASSRQAADPCQPDEPARPATRRLPGPPQLVTVRGITVDASIADQLEQLLAAAEANGLLLNGSGYRSHDRQIELRRAHCGTSNYAIYEMPSSQCSPPTARPGNSLHEQGLAIDFVNCSSRSTACHQWLAANAATYGLYNLPSEPWHWSTSGA
jgi:hypothetical protein